MKSNINSIYRKLDDTRIHQGDVLKGFKFPKTISNQYNNSFELNNYDFCIILSQDCDLEGMKNLNSTIQNTQIDETQLINGNKFLPSIIFAPAFLANKVNEGSYLSNLGYKMDNKGSKKKSKWTAIKNNNDPRYHYLKGSSVFDIPDLIIDFKIFYTAPYEYIHSKYPECYEYSLNTLFRERLSQRFFEYHSRIGLPVIQ